MGFDPLEHGGTSLVSDSEWTIAGVRGMGLWPALTFGPGAYHRSDCVGENQNVTTALGLESGFGTDTEMGVTCLGWFSRRLRAGLFVLGRSDCLYFFRLFIQGP